MGLFQPDDTEADVINKVRGIYRAYVPESDAWQEPSFYGINATIQGGLAWCAINEARNGIDARLNPSTAVAPYLDMIVALPPCRMTRNAPTKAGGIIMVKDSSLVAIPGGYVFTTAAGVTYTADATVTLDADGAGLVQVTSTGTGTAVNSPVDQPFEFSDGTAQSLGIAGGYDQEDCEALRRRYFAKRQECLPFGSPCWYQSQLEGRPGVTRSWFIKDGGAAKLVFLMENKYPCGVPLQVDIDEINAFFDDECKTGLCFCPVFCPAKSLTISPEICWTNGAPENVCDIADAMSQWLRQNYDLGQGVPSAQIQCFLDAAFPQYGGVIKCCKDYPPVCEAVYNCVELVGPC